MDEFLAYAREENLEATVIATVTEDPRMVITWNGDKIVNLSRKFLASNGASKHQTVHVEAQQSYETPWGEGTLAERMNKLVTDINVASNKGLSERFDSTIGAGTVLMPFGGKRQLTPNMAMAQAAGVQRDHHRFGDGVGLQPVHHVQEPVHRRLPVRGRVAGQAGRGRLRA